MENIAERINFAMKTADLSYGELSKITNIPKSALQRYATGVTANIPLDRIEKIALATNVKASYLLGWTREPIELDAGILRNYPDFKPNEKYLSDCVRVDNAYAEEEALEELEKSSTSEDGEDDKVSIEEMQTLLRALGFGDKADHLSEKDVLFLGGIFDLLDAWFG